MVSSLKMCYIMLIKKSWKWLPQMGSKASTEALIFAAKEQAIQPKNIMHRIDRPLESLLCRFCEIKSNSARYTISNYEKLVQNEYKR